MTRAKLRGISVILKDYEYRHPLHLQTFTYTDELGKRVESIFESRAKGRDNPFHLKGTGVLNIKGKDRNGNYFASLNLIAGTLRSLANIMPANDNNEINTGK